MGVHSKDRRLNGAVRLKISHILPGQSDQLYIDCYKYLVPPESVEVFDLAEPQPEGREFYDELKKLQRPSEL